MKILKKPKPIILIVFLASSVSLVYMACKKQNSDENFNGFLASAKTWFINTVVENENKILATLSNSAEDSYKRRFARMGKLNNRLDWNRATEFEEAGIKYVITPIKENVKPFKNQSFSAARFFIFYKDNSKVTQLKIIEILSSKESVLENQIQITKNAFLNKLFGKKNYFGNLNATVIFYDVHYNYESSFEIKNGSWKPSKARLINQDKTKNRPVNTRNQRITCQTCVHWYLVGIWYDLQTGEIVATEILNEWDECTENGPPPAGYGEAPGPILDEECSISTQNQLNDLANSASVSNATLGISTLNENAETRTKKYQWKILHSATFYLYSFERGVHVKVNNSNPNLQWNWQSLEHQNISMVGIVVGGSIEYSLISATPTIGLYNAIMDLDFKCKYSVVCKGSPFSSESVYNANKAFNVND